MPCGTAKLPARQAVCKGVTNSKLEPLDLSFGSEMPTQPDLEGAALAAHLNAKSLAARHAQAARQAQVARKEATPHKDEDPLWCDSEAPTGVEVERPVFPGPPRSPRV